MDEHGQGHILSYKSLMLVWVALLVLTALTVAVARLDLGALNIWAAIGIACVKSSLVVSFFMHMKYEKPLFKWFFLIGLGTLVVFIGLTFFDVLYR